MSWSVGRFRIVESDFHKIVFARYRRYALPMLLYPLATSGLLFAAYSFYTGYGSRNEKDTEAAVVFLLLYLLLFPLNVLIIRLLLTREKYEVNRSKWEFLISGKGTANIDEIKNITVTASSWFMREMAFWTLRFELLDGTVIDTFSADRYGDLVYLGEKITTFLGMRLYKE